MSVARYLVDSYGRRIANLRISLTDRCNFSCVYCTPAAGFPVLAKSKYLTLDEVVRLVRVIGSCGVHRVRLSGGEPLLRRDIVDIVRAVKSVAAVHELSVTTNGSRLAELAGPLRSAGLDRLNVSLDSVDPKRFQDITRRGQYDTVREGLETALQVGFPVKVNMVVLVGIPHGEIIEFVRLAVRHDIEVRFLEFMPLCGDGWEAEKVFPIDAVRDIVRAEFDLVELPRGDRTAQTFSIAGGKGRVGFIASMSEPFCDSCSRIRITAEGSIRPCLFSDYEVPLLEAMRDGASDEELLELVRVAVANKPKGNQFVDEPFRAGEGRERARKGGPFIRSVGG
jgi:molybdenum cofactor biosynthesis protein A